MAYIELNPVKVLPTNSTADKVKFRQRGNPTRSSYPPHHVTSWLKMATPTEFRSSPFNNVFQIVPQGHEKAIKQAFYNTAATLFLIFACAAAISVFFILQAFLRPLAWAVLCGTFLYPFKRTLTNVLRRWLRGLDSSGTPILVGIAVIPVQVLNSTADAASDNLLAHWQVILCGCVATPILYCLWQYSLISAILCGLRAIFLFVYEALDYFSSLWVCLY